MFTGSDFTFNWMRGRPAHSKLNRFDLKGIHCGTINGNFYIAKGRNQLLEIVCIFHNNWLLVWGKIAHNQVNQLHLVEYLISNDPLRLFERYYVDMHQMRGLVCQILNLDVKELLNKTENYGLFCANERK